jgi:putative peptidoglycan lipid II flippase
MTAVVLTAPGVGAGAAVGDSMTVAGWTVVSRVTGLARVVAIGAVLGPTFLGNTFQFANVLPNLVYYGLLAGSLFTSLLVPVLVRHVDTHDVLAARRIAGGFLGVALVGLLLLVPLAVVLGPLALQATAGGSHAAGQLAVSTWLIVMLIPQVFLYAVAGTCAAVQNSTSRFGLAAAAPAVENLGTLVVLGVVAAVYAPPRDLASVPASELALLGLGTTAAVAVHAGLQWCGARRSGVTVLPRRGWRDPEVRALVRHALPALAQAGLYALQLLTLLVVANRVAGGVVAFQVALNFYALPVALVATPVALSLLPRLARQARQGDAEAFREELARGLSFALFFTVPAAVGYVVLAEPLARALAFGQLAGSPGVTLVAVACAALAAGVVGQTAVQIGSYACYARGDTRTPLQAMRRQAATCLLGVLLASTLDGAALLAALGTSFSVALLHGALFLHHRLARQLPPGQVRLGRSLLRISAGATLMAAPVWLVAWAVPVLVGGRLGQETALLAGAVVGAGAFLVSQAVSDGPELTWVREGIAHLRAKTAA